MNDSKKSALQKIKEAREGGIKRTDQYEVSPYSFPSDSSKIEEWSYRLKNKLAYLRSLVKRSTMKGS